MRLSDDPIAQLRAWLDEAEAGEPNDPNAMTLATATPDGAPSARVVLLKGLDARGLVFFTNLGSRKGDELAANPRAALLFHWKSLRRQVRVEGEVEAASEAEADAYYASRARASRLGAWASEQSRLLPDRATLDARFEAAEARFPEEQIPRPPYWSGYRLIPSRFEFWRDGAHRLHDRTIYTRDGESWRTHLLYP